jgi:hypothetical protein
MTRPKALLNEVPYTERYPPDTAAAIFWLKNRQPKHWRDKVETVGDKPQVNIQINFDAIRERLRQRGEIIDVAPAK